MQKFDIATSILSVTAPGACILKDPQQAAALARRCNEFAAKLRDTSPDKYGFFANLPSLLDQDLALQEITYALDELNADGVTLFTRYGPGNHYLGHPDFQQIWDELARRKTVVFIHPTHPVDTNKVNPGLPQSLLEYPSETTKTAVDIIMSKTFRRHSQLKIILSHAGGTLPFLVQRPASVLPYLNKAFVYEEFVEDAKKFYYDTAFAGDPNVLTVLENFASPDRILYGSDYCYATPSMVEHHTSGLDRFPFKDPSLLQKIKYENALALIPRLAKK